MLANIYGDTPNPPLSRISYSITYHHKAPALARPAASAAEPAFYIAHGLGSRRRR